MSNGHSNHEAHGYAFMLGAVFLFALIPYYLQFLSPLNGNILFAHRVLTQVFFGLLILLFSRQLFELKNITIQTLRIMCLTTPLVAAQWWVFFWSPVNGETINLAMGYFLLPLTMSLAGRFILKESMSHLQWLAVIVALLGITLELWRSGAFSWVTLLVCLGYPPYFMLRRHITLSTKANFTVENILIIPVALLILFLAAQNNETLIPERDWGLAYLFGAGLLGTIPMLLFISASKCLSFTVFGMLNYLEPLLLVLVAVLLLGETIDSTQQWSYGCFMLAVLLVIGDSIRRQRRRK